MLLATTIFAAPFGRGFWYKRPQTLDEAYANVMWAKKTLGKESLLSCLTLISDGDSLPLNAWRSFTIDSCILTREDGLMHNSQSSKAPLSLLMGTARR